MQIEDNFLIELVDTFKFYYREQALLHFDDNSKIVNIKISQVKEKTGASGTVYLTNVTVETKKNQFPVFIAIKIAEDKVSVLKELKNAVLLENRFLTHPEFGIPKVIYSTTYNPPIMVYQGINGVNFDESPPVPKKYMLAGMLLAIIHGGSLKTVDRDLYKNFSRIIGKNFAASGHEPAISTGLGKALRYIGKKNEGCDAFSDFHQSNVMVNLSKHEQIEKMWIIDPEFMSAGNFDRMEDIGTFFGQELFIEFASTSDIQITAKNIAEFLTGYSQKFFQLSETKFEHLYPSGYPLAFFISQWALMDALDKASQGLTEEWDQKIQFALFLLEEQTIENLAMIKPSNKPLDEIF